MNHVTHTLTWTGDIRYRRRPSPRAVAFTMPVIPAVVRQSISIAFPLLGNVAVPRPHWLKAGAVPEFVDHQCDDASIHNFEPPTLMSAGNGNIHVRGIRSRPE
jgi:hypothetical protein